MVGMGNLQIVPADTRSYNVEPQLVEMMVPLYSHIGCTNKIHKALSHLKGIYSVNVDYNQQKVTVWGICNKDQVLSTVRSKRKAARFWNSNDTPTPVLLQLALQAEADQELGVNNYIASSPPPPPPPPPTNFRPSFALNKLRSLSFKLACKKLFTTARSYSFPSI